MQYDNLLIKYGELALKGKNRYLFEEQLVRNLRQKLRPFPKAKVEKMYGRLTVLLHGEDANAVIEATQDVFGIVGISPVLRTPLDLEAIKAAALSLMKEHDGQPTSFKVRSRRSNKAFPVVSDELNQVIGAHVLRNTEQITVDVHQPEVTLRVEVREQGAYVYQDHFAGRGGLPVGISGKALLLLSGGIDSPVAGYLTAKRGVKVEAVHFYSYPYTSERARQKVEDLARMITRFTGPIRLHLVPFTEIQTEIRKQVKPSYSITVMRRLMFRIATQIAHEERCLALATGESVGQVASQTLESMVAINDVTTMPILRPLISADKLEIMRIAQDIGTYETSIQPYEDCCTVFLPKSPETKPRLETARHEEAQLEWERLVNEAVKNREIISFDQFSQRHDEEFSAYFDLGE